MRKAFNNFWQALKGKVSLKKLWSVVRWVLLIGRLIYRFLQLLEGDDTE